MIRPVIRIHITSSFTKSYRKLPGPIQELARKKDQWFRHNALDFRLRTHKLRGELQGYWSYSVNESYRILFRFVGGNEAIYYDIGTHDVYR